MTDLVSIITPAYNAAPYIRECIDSALKQTYADFEMIIVDDLSTDNTIEIIESYSDPRIRLIKHAQNSGAAVTRNDAISAAQGRYIAFLDADDRWKPEKLEKQMSFMKMNNYAFTFTAYECIKRTQDEPLVVYRAPDSLSYTQCLKIPTIGCLTVIVDRQLAGDFAMPPVRRGQDHLTWLAILKRGIVAYGLNENLAEYRRVEGSLSSDKIKALKRQWHNYRHVLKLPLIPCLYYYACYAIYGVKKYLTPHTPSA